MIKVDEALCTGCGACVRECPQGAIYLLNDRAIVDATLCDGCATLGEDQENLCVKVCPSAALSWVKGITSDAQALPEAQSASSVPATIEPPVKVLSVETKKPTLWRRTFLPVVGGALIWLSREIIPRLAPLALDVLDTALEKRQARTVDTQNLATRDKCPGKGRGRRCRKRERGNQ